MKPTPNRLRAAALLIFSVMTLLFLHSELEWSSAKDHSHDSHDLCEILSLAKPCRHQQETQTQQPALVHFALCVNEVGVSEPLSSNSWNTLPPLLSISPHPIYLRNRSLLI
jgi:hypothetical protein